MNKDKQELLNQVNRNIIFFFLLVVSAGISFYVINEKKKSTVVPYDPSERTNFDIDILE